MDLETRRHVGKINSPATFLAPKIIGDVTGEARQLPKFKGIS